MLRGSTVWIGLLLAASLSGCSKAKEPWEITHPASGTLTYGGKPVSGAQVTLFPTDVKVPEKVRPTGTTEADGRFTVSTFAEGDGAPVGVYKVSIIWQPLVQGKGGASRGENQLPIKYARPDSSGFTVTVAEGTTTFPVIEIPQ
jgi:hypothetical protein